jgi:hypothetical protein
VSYIREDTLVVVSCGRMKIWGRQPHRGPTPARDAYTSDYFRVNRAYAEHFGELWVILSDKYGFIDPDFVVPEAYEVTFDNPKSGPISSEALREQVHDKGLARFKTVIGLGGRLYREKTEDAFVGTGASVRFPFTGQDIEQQKRRARQAIVTDEPF